jgi:hypothetical protein
MICLIVSTEPLQMFADDTNISIAANSVTELEKIINSDLKNLHQWLLANRLSLNIAKTEFMIIGSREWLLVHDNEHIRIEIDRKTIKSVNETKSLGLQIDEHLTYGHDMSKIFPKRLHQLLELLNGYANL